MDLIKQIYNKILEADNILLVPHQNPDADALGSVTSFMIFLDSLNKKYQGFCGTQISSKLYFLSHSEKIVNDQQILQEKFDTLIVFDSGHLDYAGLEEFCANFKGTIINIDHHNVNSHFGHINLVRPESASTTEVLYDFFIQNKIKITAQMATSLLAGILTDTDRFQNSNTSSHTMEVARKLLEKGANMNLIQKNIFKDKKINALKIWGIILKRLVKNEKLDIVYSYIKEQEIEENGGSKEDVEHISNFLNCIEEGKIKILLKEDGKFVKASLRTSADEDTDVSLYAKKLGGGGHKKAAGFKIEGTIDETIQKIIEIIKDETQRSSQNQ